MRSYNNYHSFSILFSLLLVLILDSKVVAVSSPSCQPESCGNIKIPYPFGIQQGCYLNEWYKIECRNGNSPFLFKTDLQVVNISLPSDGETYYSYTSFETVRVKSPITSIGCSRDGKETGSVLNFTGSPFFFGRGNSLVAVGCNSKASLTTTESTIKLECELNCNASKEKLPRKSVPFFDKTGCSSSNALPYAHTRDCTANKGEEERSHHYEDTLANLNILLSDFQD